MSLTKERHLKSMLALLAGVFFTGISAVLIKSASAPGVVTAFYRMLIGSVALIVPVSLYLFRLKTPISRQGVYMAILGGTFFGIDMAFWATGIVASNATMPTIAANLSPLWAGIGAFWVFKEKPYRGFWIGLFVAFSGIFLMVSNDLFSSTGLIKGILYGLIAGMFYGAYYITTQKGRSLIGTLLYLSISTFSATFVLLLAMLLFNYSFLGYDDKTWYLFFVYGLGVQVVGWMLINYAQGYQRATTVAPTLLGQPVVTAIVAYLVLGEEFTFIQFMGVIIVLVGIFLVHFLKRHT